MKLLSKSILRKSFLAISLLLIAVCVSFLTGCDNEKKTTTIIDKDFEFAIDVGDSELPYIAINTRKNEIQYQPKIMADMMIFEKKKLIQEQTIGIEYRGKTSFRLSDKKSYGIETRDAAGNDVDVSFFGFPPEEDWILAGHVVNLKDRYIIDRSLMHHFLAYEIARSMGRYASRTKWVELEINGEYLGVYVFMEKPKRDRNRIDIRSLDATSTNISGGYILTIDKASIGEAGVGRPLSYFYHNWDDDARYTSQNSFRSRYDIHRQLIPFAPFGPPYHNQLYLETYFLYEYPKAENITSQQKAYIASYIDQFETALINDNFQAGERTYLNYIDVSSFVDYFIINELCRNIDAYRISTYLQKDRDGKLAMGPVWDFNIGFAEGDRIPANDWVIKYNDHVSGDAWMMPFWWTRLLEDSFFRDAIKQRWTSLRSSTLSNVTLSGLVTSNAEYLTRNKAYARNYMKWDQDIGVNYIQSNTQLREFLINRANWMDGQINGF